MIEFYFSLPYQSGYGDLRCRDPSILLFSIPKMLPLIVRFTHGPPLCSHSLQPEEGSAEALIEGTPTLMVDTVVNVTSIG